MCNIYQSPLCINSVHSILQEIQIHHADVAAIAHEDHVSSSSRHLIDNCRNDYLILPFLVMKTGGKYTNCIHANLKVLYEVIRAESMTAAAKAKGGTAFGATSGRTQQEAAAGVLARVIPQALCPLRSIRRLS